MSAGSDERGGLLPPLLRTLPPDLAAMSVLVPLTVGVALLPGVRGTPIQLALGVPFALFAPGYTLVAVIFPEAERGDGGSTGFDSTHSRGISALERIALSFFVSIGLNPLVGLALNFSPWGIQLVPVLVALGGFTLVLAFVGAQRRAALDPEDRFQVPYDRVLSRVRVELVHPETGVDAVLNVVLVASLLLAAATVGYAAVVPKEGEAYSSLHLRTERANGTLVASDYPSDLVVGEPESLVVGVSNREHERVSYTVVSQLQRVRVEGNSTTVLEREPLARFSPTVGPNRTWNRRHTIDTNMTGEGLRLTYLLYRGAPPSDPSVENAYRSNYVWVNVTAPGDPTTG